MEPAPARLTVIPRIWHAVIAACVAASFALQVVIAVRLPGTPANVEPGRLAGATLCGRLLRVVSFFTIQSNVLSGVTSALLARRPDRDGTVWRVARLDALVGITVTGIVYSTVLARVHEPHGWDETTVNTLVHYVVPVMMVLGWLLFGPRPRVTGAVIAWSLAWPLAWFAYTLAAGEISGWYPYPFVHVPSHGYAQVLVNALLVTAVLGLVAALYAVGDRRLRHVPAAEPVLQPS